MYQTVNIWNMPIKKQIFSSQHKDICETVNIWNIGIYNWTYYIKPSTEDVPNSKNLKYGYIRYIFSRRQSYICEKVNIWNIGI